MKEIIISYKIPKDQESAFKFHMETKGLYDSVHLKRKHKVNFSRDEAQTSLTPNTLVGKYEDESINDYFVEKLWEEILLVLNSLDIQSDYLFYLFIFDRRSGLDRYRYEAG